MHWTVADVVRATGGTLARGGRGELVGVTIDSRVLRPGELFVALKGARDGHDFVADAVSAGAGGVLVESDRATENSEGGQDAVSVIEVPDTARALLSLGVAGRDRLATAEVVGITGSVGKTSTKDLTAAALCSARRVTSSEKSFNNEIGVPLTLANAPEDAQVAVIEMGAKGPGHITLLCEVARPTVAIVTAVAAAHTEAFGGLDQVAQAKGELVAGLGPGGVAILNGDDVRVRAMKSRLPEGASFCLLYSVSGTASADVVAEGVLVDGELRPTFSARTPWGDVEVTLEARGVHQVGNALAALAAAGVLGVPIEAAATSLRGARLSPWRMEISRTASGAMVINDAYNANPASLASALDALAALPARRRIAVLGEMAELGQRSDEEHLAMAERAQRLGIEVVAVGTGAYGVTPVAGVDEAFEVLDGMILNEADALLVKASRVAGLERLAIRLVAGRSRGSGSC
jgi:UDP-N-acetylmuramoyl-tripeptide--D-alanyl-D-alanine ligase